MNFPEVCAQEQRTFRGPWCGQEVNIPCVAHHPKCCTPVVPEKRVVNYKWNIAKGTTDPRVEFIFPKQPIGSYHKFKPKYWSNFIFKISAKIQLHNLCKTSAAKYWPNSSLKILPELQLQNLHQTLCSKSEQKFGFITKHQLPSMQQTVANTILMINISNSNNLNKFWVGIFTRQGHINQVY